MEIAIEEIEYYEPYDWLRGKLELVFSGKDMSNVIVNSLRRVLTDNIPMYAFPPEAIDIIENTSKAVNNTQMKLHLSNLPILDVRTDLVFLHESYWKNVNHADPERIRHPSEKIIEMYITHYNNTNEISTVTSDDIKMYIDGEEHHPYSTKHKWKIVNMKPGQTLKCHARATLGVGENHAIWFGASNSISTIEPDGKYKLVVRSNGQVPIYDLVEKAVKFLIKKMESIGIELTRRIDSKELEEKSVVFFQLDGEDHTVGGLLNEEFQSHPDIMFCGLSKPNHLVKSCLIKIISKPKVPTPFVAMFECIENLTKKLTVIDKEIKVLQKKAYDKKGIKVIEIGDLVSKSDILPKITKKKTKK